jgi:hypothetical protein
MNKQSLTDLEICNLNDNKHKLVQKFISCSDSSSEGSGSNQDEDEDFEDYAKDGYHPVH